MNSNRKQGKSEPAKPGDAAYLTINHEPTNRPAMPKTFPKVRKGLLGATAVTTAMGHLVKGPGHSGKSIDLDGKADKRLLAAAMGRFTAAPGYKPPSEREEGIIS